VWNKNIRDFTEDEFGDSPTVEDRGDPKCPRFGKTFWESVEDFFQAVIDGSGSFFEDWWESINENPGSPPQDPYSFFFYEFSNSPNWTWIPVTGGGGGAPTEFENYRVDCGIALQNFIANGFYLPKHANLDMRLCELLSELYISDNSGTTNTRLQCLYANHQSAYFEDIWQYWESSSKDQNARTVLNNFLDAACSENPSVQKAAMLRHACCLGDINIVDLWSWLIASEDANAERSAELLLEIIARWPIGSGTGPALNSTHIQFLSQNPDYLTDIKNLLSNQPNSATSREVIIYHVNHLMADPDYRQMVRAWPGLPSWATDIIKDLLVEVGAKIVKKQLGLDLPQNVIDAITSCTTGDYLGCLNNTVDVLKVAFPGLKIVGLTLDGIDFGYKIGKLYNKIDNVVTKLGDQAAEKVWAAISKKIKLLDDLNIDDWPLGIRLTNKTIDQFWDDLREVFGNPPVTETNGIKIFTALGHTFTPTISINGNSFKFRF
jgi:hypothetical protein